MQFDAADKNKTESKFKFQGQYVRSKLWFDLDLDWIGKNVSTIGNYFKFMTISKTKIHSKLFKFQLKMQDFLNHLCIKKTPQLSDIVKKR